MIAKQLLVIGQAGKQSAKTVAVVNLTVLKILTAMAISM
jgi:hypothetical protein